MPCFATTAHALPYFVEFLPFFLFALSTPSCNCAPLIAFTNTDFPLRGRRCGEHFPRGRLDTLTSHLTKKCPGISESDRMNALLTLSGMSAASQRIHQGHPNGQPSNQAMGAPSELMALQHDTEQQTQSQQTEGPWSALGVLAEVSRQFTQHETNNERAIPSQNPPSLGLGVSAGGLSAPLVAERAIEDTGDENATQGTKSRSFFHLYRTLANLSVTK